MMSLRVGAGVGAGDGPTQAQIRWWAPSIALWPQLAATFPPLHTWVFPPGSSWPWTNGAPYRAQLSPSLQPSPYRQHVMPAAAKAAVTAPWEVSVACSVAEQEKPAPANPQTVSQD